MYELISEGVHGPAVDHWGGYRTQGENRAACIGLA